VHYVAEHRKATERLTKDGVSGAEPVSIYLVEVVDVRANRWWRWRLAVTYTHSSPPAQLVQFISKVRNDRTATQRPGLQGGPSK